MTHPASDRAWSVLAVGGLTEATVLGEVHATTEHEAQQKAEDHYGREVLVIPTDEVPHAHR